MSLDSAGPPIWSYTLTSYGPIYNFFYEGAGITDASVTGEAEAAGWTVEFSSTLVTFSNSTPLTSGSVSGFEITGTQGGTGSWLCGRNSGEIEGPFGSTSFPVELSELSIEPENPTVGDEATIEFKVSNIGNTPIPSGEYNFSIEFLDEIGEDGDTIRGFYQGSGWYEITSKEKRIYLPELKPGKEKTVETEVYMRTGTFESVPLWFANLIRVEIDEEGIASNRAIKDDLYVDLDWANASLSCLLGIITAGTGYPAGDEEKEIILATVDLISLQQSQLDLVKSFENGDVASGASSAFDIIFTIGKELSEGGLKKTVFYVASYIKSLADAASGCASIITFVINFIQTAIDHGLDIEFPLEGLLDVSGDGVIDVSDLVLVGRDFGKTGDDIEGDVNSDGEVNIFDLVLVGKHFGEKAAPSITKISLLQQIYDMLKTVPNPNQNLKLALKELEKLLAPSETVLLQNYPNPFNPETWIPFQLSSPANVVISIYDVEGQLIRKIGLGKMPAGMYLDKDKAVYWDGRNSSGEKVSSGLYFYTIHAGEYRATKHMLILK